MHDADRSDSSGWEHGRQHGRPAARRRLRGVREDATAQASPAARSTRACAGATSPREVAEAADVVFTSLPDDDASRRRLRARRASSPGSNAGKSAGDMSTVSPRASRELAERVARRARRDARRPGLRQRSPGRERNPDDHGRRRRGRLRARSSRCSASSGRRHPHRRKRAGAAAQARGQHQPRRTDARLLAKVCCSPNAKGSTRSSPPR